MDYSGKGLWNIYRLASNFKFRTKMTDGGQEDHYRQSISLAINGLYCEDLAIIKHVFGENPALLKETSASFKELKSKGSLKLTSLWPLKNVSKMAPASQSKWGANQGTHHYSIFYIHIAYLVKVPKEWTTWPSVGVIYDPVGLKGLS